MNACDCFYLVALQFGGYRCVNCDRHLPGIDLASLLRPGSYLLPMAREVC